MCKNSSFSRHSGLMPGLKPAAGPRLEEFTGAPCLCLFCSHQRVNLQTSFTFLSLNTEGFILLLLFFSVTLFCKVASWLLISMSQVKGPWLPEVGSGLMSQYRPGAAHAAVHRGVSTRLQRCFLAPCSFCSSPQRFV